MRERVRGLGRVNRGGRTGGRGRGRSEKGGDLDGSLGETRVMEGVMNDGTVNSWAGDLGEGGESTIGKVPAVPEIKGRRVPMISDKFAKPNVNMGERMEVCCGVDEGRTNGEETKVKGPRIFKGRASRPEGVGAD